MKTKKLFLASLLMLLLQTNIFAQQGEIIYTDFEPDSIIDISINTWGDVAYFDINNDGENEFKFSWYFHSAVADVLHSISTTSKKMMLTVMDTIGQVISSQETWHVGYDSWNFPIETETNYLMGFRQEIDGGYYYGWISYTRINKKRDYLILDNMAFCTIPNYPLKFGQMYLEGIEENEADSKVFTVYPNPASEFITIENNGNQEFCEVALYNANGQLLGSWNGDENIDIRNFQNGMYILKINTNDNNSFFKKFVIAK